MRGIHDQDIDDPQAVRKVVDNLCEARWIGNRIRLRSRQRKRMYVRLAELYGDKCWYCERPFDGLQKRHRTIDHLTPSSRGGSSSIENLVLSCHGCNNLKGDRTWWEWVSSPEYASRLEKMDLFEPKQQRRFRIRTVSSLEVPCDVLVAQ